MRKPILVSSLTLAMLAMTSCSIQSTEDKTKQDEQSGEDSSAMAIPPGTGAASILTLPEELSAGSIDNSQQDRLALDDAPAPVPGPIDPIEPPQPPQPVMPPPDAQPPVMPPPPVLGRAPIELNCVKEPLAKEQQPVIFRALLRGEKGEVLAASRSRVPCRVNVVLLHHLPAGVPLKIQVAVMKAKTIYVGTSESFVFKGETVRVPLVLKKHSGGESAPDAIIDIIFEDGSVNPAMNKVTKAVQISNPEETGRIIQAMKKVPLPKSEYRVELAARKANFVLVGHRAGNVYCDPAGNCQLFEHPDKVFMSPELAKALRAQGGDMASEVICGQVSKVVYGEAGPLVKIAPLPPQICVANDIIRRPTGLGGRRT